MGSKSQTSTSTSQPPAWLTSELQQLGSQGQQIASQPLQQYQGPLVAGFTPAQTQAMDTIAGATGVANPYINSAAQAFGQATTPLWGANLPQFSTGQLNDTGNAGLGLAGRAANTNVIGAGQPGLAAAYQGVGQAGLAAQQGQAAAGAGANTALSSAFQPYNVDPYMSPYTQDVVNATEQQFANQNEQQQQGVIGNAIASGAWGGDRSAVAQALTAGQQSLAESPVIAGLYNTGYQNAQNEFNTQQALRTQTGLQAGQLGLAGADMGLQAGQLGAQTGLQAAGLGQSGAATQGQLGLSGAGQLLNEFNQQQQAQLGANEANAWLNSQAAFGLGNLGQEAQNTLLTGANAELGVGGLQQQLAQEQLNIPYEQFQQQQAYPFQTLGWLAGIEEGGGGLAGGTSSTTSPGPSALSQIAGLGLAGAGIYSLLSDKRAKTGLEPVGKLKDGQTVYRYRYKGDPTYRLGLVAQEVEKRHPEAVHSANGLKAVDYKAATDKAAHRASGGTIDTGIPDVSISYVPTPMAQASSRSSIPQAPGPSPQPEDTGTASMGLVGAIKDLTKGNQTGMPMSFMDPGGNMTTGSNFGTADSPFYVPSLASGGRADKSLSDADLLKSIGKLVDDADPTLRATPLAVPTNMPMGYIDGGGNATLGMNYGTPDNIFYVPALAGGGALHLAGGGQGGAAPAAGFPQQGSPMAESLVGPSGLVLPQLQQPGGLTIPSAASVGADGQPSFMNPLPQYKPPGTTTETKTTYSGQPTAPDFTSSNSPATQDQVVQLFKTYLGRDPSQGSDADKAWLGQVVGKQPISGVYQGIMGSPEYQNLLASGKVPGVTKDTEVTGYIYPHTTYTPPVGIGAGTSAAPSGLGNIDLSGLPFKKGGLVVPFPVRRRDDGGGLAPANDDQDPTPQPKRATGTTGLAPQPQDAVSAFINAPAPAAYQPIDTGRYQQALEHPHVDPWMSVLAAGLGMMSGTSPFAGVNIGRGALEGLRQYQSDRAAAQKSTQEEFNIEDRAKELADSAERYRSQQAAAKADLAEKVVGQQSTAKYQQGELGLRGQELGLQGRKLALEEAESTPLVLQGPNGEQRIIAVPKYSTQMPDVPEGWKIEKPGQNLSGTLSPETLQFSAEQILAGDTSPLQGLGIGTQGAANRAALRTAVAELAKQRGYSGADLAAIDAQYFGTKAGERALGTRSANLELASNEFQSMAPLALQASSGVDRTQFPSLNSVDLAAQRGLGGENVVRLQAATNSLVNIYARAINPSGVPTDADKAHAREILDNAYSKGQYSAAVDQLNREIQAARKAPGAVREELRSAVGETTAGKQTAAPQAGPALPDAARAQLRPGHVTVFGNGQKWTLDPQGNPQQVQ